MGKLNKQESNMCRCPYCGKLIDCDLKRKSKTYKITKANQDEDELPVLDNSHKSLSFDDFLNNNF